jgi:hypothetical protein
MCSKFIEIKLAFNFFEFIIKFKLLFKNSLN